LPIVVLIEQTKGQVNCWRRRTSGDELGREYQNTCFREALLPSSPSFDLSPFSACPHFLHLHGFKGQVNCWRRRPAGTNSAESIANSCFCEALLPVPLYSTCPHFRPSARLPRFCAPEVGRFSDQASRGTHPRCLGGPQPWRPNPVTPPTRAVSKPLTA
jgi:hypothetical protein